MTWLHAMILLLVAFLVVFAQATVTVVRDALGAQVDLLPGLMVYAGLTCGMVALTLLAVCGGLWFDSLSANPLGVSVLPLFLVAFVIYHCRRLIMRNQTYAQVVLGAAASAAVPLLVLLLLILAGRKPSLSVASLWQWGVMAGLGGLMTPVWFWVFDRISHAFFYKPLDQGPWRGNREIKRGRF
jgi:cell shape-determining protein MreD